MRNILCIKCWDTGKVGIFKKRKCPKCGGNPKSLLPPKPKTKPFGQKG